MTATGLTGRPAAFEATGRPVVSYSLGYRRRSRAARRHNDSRALRWVDDGEVPAVDEAALRSLVSAVIGILVRRGADFAAAEDAV